MLQHLAQSHSTTLAFWLMGALNNMPYVVMLAGAKSISEGGTALVFLANITPGLLIKLSSPYWFEKVSYKNRIMAGSILMSFSFILVATFGLLKEVKLNGGAADAGCDHLNNDCDIKSVDLYLIMQLLGVACSSAQGSLGEATLLALSGKVDSMLDKHSSTLQQSDSILSRIDDNDDDDEIEYAVDNAALQTVERKAWSITAFSSGTGLAGVLGFAYVVLLTDVLNLPLTTSLYIAMVFPIMYYVIYRKWLHPFTMNDLLNSVEDASEEIVAMNHGNKQINDVLEEDDWVEDSSNLKIGENDSVEDFPNNPSTLQQPLEVEQQINSINDDEFIKKSSAIERLKLTLSFWPFMIPLFIVYASEYALQSGVWTAIGFPVDNEDARKSFYVKSNWLYQVGVFISRSSGALCIAPMWSLWLMPILQCVNLVIFYLIATNHFWYNNMMLIGCFYVGLLGGGVYVNGYMRVNKDLPVGIREFALSTVSIADSLGIVFADYIGLYIQSCLYQSNGIDGAVVQCPL